MLKTKDTYFFSLNEKKPHTIPTIGATNKLRNPITLSESLNNVKSLKNIAAKIKTTYITAITASTTENFFINKLTPSYGIIVFYFSPRRCQYINNNRPLFSAECIIFY